MSDQVSLSIDYSERRASALGGGDVFSPARGSGVLSIAHASGISLSDSDAHPLDVEPCPATPPPAYVAPLADDASCSPVSALARRILDKAGATPEDRCSPEELRAAAAAAAVAAAAKVGAVSGKEESPLVGVRQRQRAWLHRETESASTWLHRAEGADDTAGTSGLQSDAADDASSSATLAQFADIPPMIPPPNAV